MAQLVTQQSNKSVDVLFEIWITIQKRKTAKY